MTETLGQADDLVQADGRAILSWSQAFEKAAAWVKRQRNGNPLADGRITVRQAVELYTGVRDDRDSKRRGRTVRSDAASRLTLHVLSDSHLPGTKMADLSEGDLRNWQRRLGELKSTTKQRLINDLKAALNSAYLDNRLALPVDLAQTIKVGLRPVFAEDAAEPIARVDQVLSDDQVRRIVQAVAEVDDDGDFGRLVLVLAATGARFSQVKRMLVQDVQPEQSRLLIPRPTRAGERIEITSVSQCRRM
jgi:integrase